MTPILHLHIPKTGGSSLETLLKREYGDGYVRVPNWRQSTPSVWKPAWGDPEEMRRRQCISGHFYFGFWEALNEVLPSDTEPVFLTFVRHPIDRLLSLYHYWRTNPNRYSAALDRMTFAEFVRSDRHDWQFLDNDMVRRIAGVEGVNSKVGTDDLRRAIDHLGYFPMVGLTDHFDETISRWAELFGWQSIDYEHRLGQPERLQREELGADLVAEIEDRQLFDCALYMYVLARDWMGWPG